ncbi:MAG: pyridoxamine 5-phosphate oxidase [Frankiales bacterium]|nr:pyridoxamine 5-phosphate oxidase [Frankiales bacterium]
MSGDGHPSVADLRRQYGAAGLHESELAADPMTQFGRWFADVLDAGATSEPNAMVLSTVGCDGTPSSRMVLLKGYDERGFVFYTNYRSRKGLEIAGNPAVSLQFPWNALERQVVVTGDASKVDRTESAAYFRTRPYASQLGAWASPQSEVVAGREELDRRYAEVAESFPEGYEVPLPDHWGGYVVRPWTVEFWQGRPGRMHDRLRYRRADDGRAWVVERLAP